MPHGEQAGPGPVGHSDLRIDVLHVVVDGLAGDDETLGDLPIRPAPREQAQHLDLPGGEAGRPRPATPDRMPGSLEHSLGTLRILPGGAHLLTQVPRGVGAQAARIARPIDALVMQRRGGAQPR